MPPPHTHTASLLHPLCPSAPLRLCLSAPLHLCTSAPPLQTLNAAKAACLQRLAPPESEERDERDERDEDDEDPSDADAKDEVALPRLANPQPQPQPQP